MHSMLISSKYYNILLNGKMWNLRNKNKVVHKRVFCARFLILVAPITLDGGLSAEFTSRRIWEMFHFQTICFYFLISNFKTNKIEKSKYWEFCWESPHEIGKVAWKWVTRFLSRRKYQNKQKSKKKLTFCKFCKTSRHWHSLILKSHKRCQKEAPICHWQEFEQLWKVLQKSKMSTKNLCF